MNRGPISGRGSKVDPVAKAQAAWGEAMPKEVLALAEACRAATASAIAARLNYSDAVISQTLAGTYRGDLNKVFATIRGALMGEVVMCPVLDEIGKDRCLSEQGKPFSATSSTRARLYHACKICPSRQQKDSA